MKSAIQRARVCSCAAILVLLHWTQNANAQTILTTGIATGAIACAPSNNGTGHMICVEYTTAGAVRGTSWQAPPGPRATDPTDTVQPPVSLNAPAGTPTGSPGCGPSNDSSAAASCLIISTTSTGLSFQAVKLYPPSGFVIPLSATTLISTQPAGTVVGKPSCANAGVNVPAAPNVTLRSVVLCVMTVNGQIEAIAFEPQAGISMPLQTVSGTLVNVIGNPSCASAAHPNPAGLNPDPKFITNVVCAVRQGQGLTGFAVQFNQSGTTGTIAYLGSVHLPAGAFAGDPGCAPIGAQPATSIAVNCAIVSGNTVLGIGFDPQAGTTTGNYQSLGSPPDGGTWNANLGCTSFRTAANQNANLTGCEVVSSTTNVFEVTFDPQTATARGPLGPFAAQVNGSQSCLELATDFDLMYCGQTSTAGAAEGLRLPVGILGPGATTSAVALSVL